MLAYEELKGSSGREIWFRPTRYDARKLFPNHAPRVRIKAGNYQLHDISLTGISVVAKQAADVDLELGEVVPVTFQQAGFSIFEGKAKVRRTENTVFGSKLAFSFEDGYVDFDRLLSRNVQAQIAAITVSSLGQTAMRWCPRNIGPFVPTYWDCCVLIERSWITTSTWPTSLLIALTSRVHTKPVKPGLSSSGAHFGFAAMTSCAASWTIASGVKRPRNLPSLC